MPTDNRQTSQEPSPGEVEIAIKGLGDQRRAQAQGLVQDHVDELKRRHDDLVMVRVVLERAQGQVGEGIPWRMRVRLTSPGIEAVATSEPGYGDDRTGLEQVIARTFDAAESQLRDSEEKRRDANRR